MGIGYFLLGLHSFFLFFKMIFGVEELPHPDPKTPNHLAPTEKFGKQWFLLPMGV